MRKDEAIFYQDTYRAISSQHAATLNLDNENWRGHTKFERAPITRGINHKSRFAVFVSSTRLLLLTDCWMVDNALDRPVRERAQIGGNEDKNLVPSCAGCDAEPGRIHEGPDCLTGHWSM